jgi:glycosyltransferase 2 family protein
MNGRQIKGPKASLFLKFLLGPLFVAWMARSGKLNLHQIVVGLSHWQAISAIIVLLCMQPGITAWRWNLLLKAQDIQLPYQQAFGLTMIGLFFNVVIPGAVGGDLIKGYYITRASEGRRSSAATSILMDRVLGVLGLFLLAVLMIAPNFRELARNPATRRLGVVVVGGLIVGMGFVLSAGLMGSRVSEWSFLPSVARNVSRSLCGYHKKAAVIPVAIAVSAFSHLLACMAYYIALRSMGGAHIPAGYFFLLVPLGLVATAIPISPAGIGVGQVAFFALFRIVSGSHAIMAADAFTVFQLTMILISLGGFCWYLPYSDVKVGTRVPSAY